MRGIEKMGYDLKFFETLDYLDLLVARTIQELAKSKCLTSILDVGCGTGRLVKYLNDNGFKAIGIDPTPIAVDLARRNNKNDSIFEASATNLPFPDGSFDLVIAISVIEHLTGQETNEFLNESFRCLKPNGFLFLITPNFSSPLRYVLGKKWFGYHPTHINYFNRRTLCAILRNYEFKKTCFRVKTPYNISFDRHLPGLLRKLPMPIKKLMNHMVNIYPLSIFRESLWVYAQR